MDDDVPPMCRECGGKCCRYVCFQIDTPDSFEAFEDLRWFLLHEGISMHVEKGDWYISIANRCKALADDGAHCAVYADRPLICRCYSMEDCDFTDDDYGHEADLNTPEDLERYAMKVLGTEAYQEAKAKAYAKAARREARRTDKHGSKARGSRRKQAQEADR
jgi:Fe-S-cluster containining protein